MRVSSGKAAVKSKLGIMKGQEECAERQTALSGDLVCTAVELSSNVS